MPQFIFKLQAVLRQRKNIEQQRQRELVGVQRRLVAIEQQLRAVDNGVRAAEEDLRQNRLLGKLDLSFLAAHRRYSLAMRRKVLELAKVMAGAQKQVDEARARLVEAAKQRKVIEKLRERQMERWREEQARRETADNDEVTTQLTHIDLNLQAMNLQAGAES